MRIPLGSHTTMDRLQTWPLRAASVALDLVERFYGVVFLAVGAVFLYWSGRGFIAHAHGIREAWADPTACAIGLIVATLALWAGVNVVRRGIPSRTAAGHAGVGEELDSTIQEALTLERTDPAAARQVLDDHFAREAVATETRREDLRRRAPQDISAALALRDELMNDISANALLRKRVIRKWPAEKRASMLLQLDTADDNLNAELSQLAATIDRLRLH
jgi:hypothetical protein